MKRHLLGSAAFVGLMMAATACNSGNPAGQSTAPASTPVVTPGSPAATVAVPSRPTVQPVPPGRGGTPAGGLVDPRKVNQLSAVAVAGAALTATYRMDTAIDNSPRDAEVRARPFLSVALANALSTPMPGGGGSDWNTWALHRSYTQVLGVADVTEAGAPADTDTQAVRSLQVTYQALGRDRWRGPKLTSTAFVTLERSSRTSPWRVSAVEGD